MPDADPTTESEGFRAYKAGLAAREMPENAPKRQNRYNRQAGDKWRDQVIAYHREFGWTGAGPMLEKGRGDILGIGDVTAECTLEPWDHIWEKQRQATRDAGNNGHDRWGVWKKRNRVADPGQAGVLVLGEVWCRVLWRLEKLEAAELDAAAEYDRGYRNGQRAARQEAV